MINYVEKGVGLVELLAESGVKIVNGAVRFTPLSDEETQSIIDNYDPLLLARSDALVRINAQSQAVMQGIEDEYPEFEKRTWPTQKAEAEAWSADNSAPAPVLNAIADARGVDRDVLKSKTLSKSLEYNTIAATLAGKRQALEDQIKSSSDLLLIGNINLEL